MPNVKIFVDEKVHADRAGDIRDMLLPLRDLLCETLSVPVAACQLAVIPVMGLEDQPLINMEYQYLATPDRTPGMIRTCSTAYRAFITERLGHVPAVRSTPLDPATYVALK